jgi:integrase
VAADNNKKKSNKKRRGRGEGSVYFDDARQLWVCQVSLGRDPLTGKRRRETVYGQTKGEVQDKLLELHQKAADGRLDRTEMTVRAFLEFWLGHIKANVSRATYAHYRGQVNKHLIPQLGSLRLADVTAFHVAQVHRKVEEGGASSATRHQIAVRLRQCLGYAVRLGLINVSPAARVDLPRFRSKQVTPFTTEQLAALLRAAQGTRLFAIYVLALDSGARVGELLALEWSDFAEGSAEVVISKTLEQGRDKAAKEPKTMSSRRRILLSAQTVAVLCEHRKALAEAGYKGPLMFPSLRRQGYLDYASFVDHYYYPALQKAGLPRYTFHTLRHTCATLLLQRGVNVKVVSEWLGHKTVKITLDTYGHVMPTMQVQAAAQMSALLEPILASAKAPEQAGAENGSSLAASGEDAA